MQTEIQRTLRAVPIYRRVADIPDGGLFLHDGELYTATKVLGVAYGPTASAASTLAPRSSR